MNHSNQFAARLKLSVCLLALLGASESFANLNTDVLSTELQADPSRARKIFQQQIRPVLRNKKHADHAELKAFLGNKENVTENLKHLSVAKQKELITKYGEKVPDALFVTYFEKLLAENKALNAKSQTGRRIPTAKELANVKALFPLFVEVSTDPSSPISQVLVIKLREVLEAFPAILSITDADKLIAFAQQPPTKDSAEGSDLLCGVLTNLNDRYGTDRQKFLEKQSLELYKGGNEKIKQFITNSLLSFLQTKKKYYSFKYLQDMIGQNPALSAPIAVHIMKYSKDPVKLTYAHGLLSEVLLNKNSFENKLLIDLFETSEKLERLTPQQTKQKLASFKSKELVSQINKSVSVSDGGGIEDSVQKMLGNEYNKTKELLVSLTPAQRNGLLKELNAQTNKAGMSTVLLTFKRTAAGLAPELGDQAGKLAFSLDPQY